MPCNGLEKPTFMVEFERFKDGISTWKFKSSIRRPNSSIPDHRHSDSTDRPILMEKFFIWFWALFFTFHLVFSFHFLKLLSMEYKYSNLLFFWIKDLRIDRFWAKKRLFGIPFIWKIRLLPWPKKDSKGIYKSLKPYIFCSIFYRSGQ